MRSLTRYNEEFAYEEPQGHRLRSEAKRLRLLAAALELQRYTSTAANMVPVSGADQVGAIGTPTEVRQLLAAGLNGERS